MSQEPAIDVRPLLHKSHSKKWPEKQNAGTHERRQIMTEVSLPLRRSDQLILILIDILLCGGFLGGNA